MRLSCGLGVEIVLIIKSLILNQEIPSKKWKNPIKYIAHMLFNLHSINLKTDDGNRSTTLCRNDQLRQLWLFNDRKVVRKRKASLLSCVCHTTVCKKSNCTVN